MHPQFADDLDQMLANFGDFENDIPEPIPQLFELVVGDRGQAFGGLLSDDFMPSDSAVPE